MEMLSQFFMERTNTMNVVYAKYNIPVKPDGAVNGGAKQRSFYR